MRAAGDPRRRIARRPRAKAIAEALDALSPVDDRAAGDGWLALLGGGEFSFGETAGRRPRLAREDAAGPDRLRAGGLRLGGLRAPLHDLSSRRRFEREVEVIPIYRARDARRGKNAERIRGLRRRLPGRRRHRPPAGGDRAARPAAEALRAQAGERRRGGGDRRRGAGAGRGGAQHLRRQACCPASAGSRAARSRPTSIPRTTAGCASCWRRRRWNGGSGSRPARRSCSAPREPSKSPAPPSCCSGAEADFEILNASVAGG